MPQNAPPRPGILNNVPLVCHKMLSLLSCVSPPSEQEKYSMIRLIKATPQRKGIRLKKADFPLLTIHALYTIQLLTRITYLPLFLNLN